MSAQADTISAARPAGPWIYGPWLDLLIGCGAWSAPLLAVAMWLTASHVHAWASAFYLLALAFNYPHFMATVYRAYHTRADFEKYKLVTLHVTLLLALTGVLLHASHGFLPWVFTLYICWSPWHYTGQNYGLLMMFARRSGGTVTPGERRLIRAAFIASFLMLLASFETGGSTDPLILSLGLPASVTLPLRLALGAAFGVLTALAFRKLIQRNGARAMAAPLTLAVTQFFWFVLPTFLELNPASQVPQTRYSSGILAVMHSAQYLWITSYYQQREARVAGNARWRMTAYFLTLIAGGIALFIPGPWLVSRVFHFDFTTSFLIFMALVNIHHFILDGAIWKLRDSRIASLLIQGGGGVQTNAGTQPSETGAAGAAPVRRLGSRVLTAPAFRVFMMALLFLWGGMDQIHFSLSTNEGNLPALLRAARMNPYDRMVQARIASAEARAGERSEAIAALTRAVAIYPYDEGLQHACARAMLEDGRYQDAYNHYAKMLKLFPRDTNALVNYGLLAARLGHPDEAIDSWEKAVDVDPAQPQPHLHLADAFDQKGEPAAAARHWQAFLQFAAAHPNDPLAGAGQRISATIEMADDESRSNRPDEALAAYRSAVALARDAGDAKLESLTLAHLAELQEKTGDAKSAADSYQQALALDAKAGDPRSEAFDWFNYGQFLRRRGLSDELAYACFLRAENLLASTGGADLDTVKAARREVETRLGNKAPTSQKNLPILLARATALPTASF
ncbi:MAG TPA: tetratricopeptide repeat protein [Candidatus Acidoferrales bacterium]|nr:tetratricopeptide repeat protein [Candidatus Acidoferrales bacterium]